MIMVNDALLHPFTAPGRCCSQTPQRALMGVLYGHEFSALGIGASFMVAKFGSFFCP